MQLVENAAPGVIKQAQLCKFANTSCGGFEAMASRGYLWVTVMNTGYAAAQYTVTVRKAMDPVRVITQALLLLITQSWLGNQKGCESGLERGV